MSVFNIANLFSQYVRKYIFVLATHHHNKTTKTSTSPTMTTTRTERPCCRDNDFIKYCSRINIGSSGDDYYTNKYINSLFQKQTTKITNGYSSNFISRGKLNKVRNIFGNISRCLDIS